MNKYLKQTIINLIRWLHPKMFGRIYVRGYTDGYADASNKKKKFVTARSSLNSKQKRELIEAAKGVCGYCNQHSDDLTIDHKIPLCDGGTDNLSNLIVACLDCNSMKGHRSLEEFKMRLERRERFRKKYTLTK